MQRINQNYNRMPGNYLFAEMKERIGRYEASHPDVEVIRLSIGDVTLPIVPSVIRALHKAVDEMGVSETFRGYAPDLGYSFLREAIADKVYKPLGCSVDPDEIFISDGAKCDTANIQELFSEDCRIAVCDPVYPVYVDSNALSGRTGTFDPAAGRWSRVIYLPMTAENGFVPELPEETPDLIYLCSPANPTGTVLTREELGQWVDYARRTDAVILFDAAYEVFIEEDDVPHSIFEIPGARECCIEFRSFSKSAGFTGLRLAYSVVPKELYRGGVSLHGMWTRRHETKFNSAPYIIQRAGEAVFTEEAQKELGEQIRYYKRNARVILEGMHDAGYEAYGGVNSPYVWLKVPDGAGSWEYFDHLLDRAHVAGTPGAGFGPCGEGYLRLTAFNTYEKTVEAVQRIRELV